MKPKFQTFTWNGFRVEAEAYVNGNDVEFDSITIYDHADIPMDTLSTFAELTPVKRTTHVKDPIAEMTTLFLECEAEYHEDMINSNYD